MSHTLQIFVKHPVAGQTKTRLAAGIGHPKALKAYGLLLEKMKEIALSLQEEVSIEIWYGNLIPESDLWSDSPFPRFLQWGEDIGARMMNAMNQALDKGAGKVVLVGSDLPHLTDEIVREAFDALSEEATVFGPAEDGGYYLIGMTAMSPEIFTDMTWSVDDVLAESQQRLAMHSKTWAEVATLNDLDTVEDLKGTFLEGLIDLP